MEAKQIAEKWISAFNEHDINKLLDLYDNDAQHYSPRIEKEKPETRGWIKGKQELRKWWQGSFERLVGLRYILKDLTSNKNKIFIEYIREVTGQKDEYVMEYLSIKNGLIIESRVLRSWII